MREPSPHSALAAQNFVDRSRAAIDPAPVVNRVQFLEQIFEPELREARAMRRVLEVVDLDRALGVEPANPVGPGPAQLACAVDQDGELAARDAGVRSAGRSLP